MEDPGPSAAYFRQFPGTSNGPLRPPSPGSPILKPEVDPIEEGTSESLYAILNLPSSASDAQIRERYRSLAATFHPDRQRDAETRLAAHGRFTALQRAYEVLTDPTKRTIYDLFGEEGLKTSWEVGPRIKTTEEMRAHFQAQAYDKRSMDAEALVKPKGDISVVLDARAVFLPPSFFKSPTSMSHSPLARLSRVRPGQIMMKHSFEVPVGKKTQVVMTGQAVTRSGSGGGNVVATVRHAIGTRIWGEVGLSLLNPRIVSAKGTFSYDEHTYLTVNAQQPTIYAPPITTLQLGRRIYPHTTGFITMKSGFFTLGPWGSSLPLTYPLRREKSALAVGLTTAHPNGSGWTVETQAGIVANHISADWSTRLMGIRVKLGAAMGTDSGINAFVDGEGKVTGNVRVGCMVQAELGGGVTMRWRFSRLGQIISVPILLSHNLNPYIVLGSTVIPATTYAALYHFYILPRRKRRIAERIKELRVEHADYILQKRSEAHDALTLLERPTAQRVEEEKAKNGLIIVSAHYGRALNFSARGIRLHSHAASSSGRNPSAATLENGSADHDGLENHHGEQTEVEAEEEEEEVVIDVTVPVQALVVDSKLHIPGGRAKFNLLGFWDPCIGENKKLRIRYLFRNKLHEVTVDDVSAVRAPLKAHALDVQ